MYLGVKVLKQIHLGFSQITQGSRSTVCLKNQELQTSLSPAIMAVKGWESEASPNLRAKLIMCIDIDGVFIHAWIVDK